MMEVCMKNVSSMAGGAPRQLQSLTHPVNDCQPSTAAGLISLPTPTPQKRPKRDFRFQIVEVPCESTKWLIWPSRKRGSQEEIDENHNHSAVATSSDSYEVNANGYGALRRTVARQSQRRDRDNCSRTASEPASENRRMSQKAEKAITEPITPSSNGSTASDSFEIQSIAKKWESFEISDDLDD